MSKTFKTFLNQHFVVLQFGVRVKKNYLFCLRKGKKILKARQTVHANFTEWSP